MFVDLDLEPFIRAMLDIAPHSRTGFMTQMNAEDLQFFISGEDGRVLGEAALIMRRGMTPVPNVTPGQIQQTLHRLQQADKVVPTCVTPSGQCYAWNRPDHYASYYTRRQRFRFWRERRRTVRALERAAQRGEEILSKNS